MSRTALVSVETGELQLFDGTAPDYPAGAYQPVDVPDGYPEVLGWDSVARAFRWPRYLTADQVYGLFTPDEKAAIHGSIYPPVHGLVTALFAHRGLIDLDSSFHQQGVALLLGLGLLSEARAQSIAAGSPVP